MALIDGDDFVDGSLLSYQEGNRLKNNWRDSTAPSNPQPGMLFSDEDDDKLWHYGVASGTDPDEVLQETRSFDAEPIFDALQLTIVAYDVSDPPTDNELDTAMGGAPATKGDGWHCFLQDTTSGGKFYLVVANGSSWYYQALTLAV
jgi:hypothetical protein